jgi:hypothetical protein
MTYRHPLAFLLGLEGIALLRADAGDGFDAAYTEERIAEVRAMLAAYDRGEFGTGETVGATDTVTGYRSWSAHYDEFNPLIVVEEPPVRELLDTLPAGPRARCGLRHRPLQRLPGGPWSPGRGRGLLQPPLSLARIDHRDSCVLRRDG